MSINNLEVYIPFYTCKYGKEKHLYLLQQFIESAKREGVKRLFVIDGSPSMPLKPEEVDAEIIRNEKHMLGFALNIAIEYARQDFFFAVTGSMFGLGTLKNMIQEKKTLEEQLGKPVALCARQASYPTEDKWLLDSPMAGTIEMVKKELDYSGFKYTEEGIAISKQPRTEWKMEPIQYARCLGAGYLANKERLLEIGGADVRCYCIDYDTGMRWISFGWLLVSSESVRLHRICGTSERACPQEKRLDETGTFCPCCGHNLETINAIKCPVCNGTFERPIHFRAWMKYLPGCTLMQLWNNHAYATPLHQNPSLYRESLKPFYQAEYDLLRKNLF